MSSLRDGFKPSYENSVTDIKIACLTSVSVRFRSKERGTRVKDRAKIGASKLINFSRGQNRKSLSTVFFCSETKRKRLLRRLILKLRLFLLVSGRLVGANPDGHQNGVSISSSINLCKSFLRISYSELLNKSCKGPFEPVSNNNNNFITH